MTIATLISGEVYWGVFLVALVTWILYTHWGE